MARTARRKCVRVLAEIPLVSPATMHAPSLVGEE